jgi:putative tryptophan/tyrosine transport system substrate-binding protein
VTCPLPSITLQRTGARVACLRPLSAAFDAHAMCATLFLVMTAQLFALAVLLVPIAGAQQTGKIPRIGLLVPTFASRTAAFRQGLRDLGYVEGQNIVIESRYAEGSADRLASLAAELVDLKVDVFVIEGNAGIAAGKNATNTIPIVMAPSGDPIGAGFVASLARPGGNLTGLSLLLTGLARKRLELLTEAVPKVRRVAVLWSPSRSGTGGTRASDLAFEETRTAAQALRVQLQSLEVKGANDLDRAFLAMRTEHAGALLVVSNSLLFAHRQRLADLAVKYRIPAMFEFREYAEAGGLLTYGASLDDLSRRAAIYVDKILKGAKPGDLPIEQPTRFELVVNRRTAKTLGLTIPQLLLLRTDQVLE